MSIRFEKLNPTDSVTIPAAAMKLSGFAPGEDARYHTLSDAVVVLKKRMNASELIRAAWALKQLSAELCTHLAMQCRDGECGECADPEKGCPYSALDFTHDIDLPDELLEMAASPRVPRSTWSWRTARSSSAPTATAPACGTSPHR